MNNKFILFSIISLIGCLTAISSDVYAPSLPSIAINLETSIDLVQWSMGIFMLGLSISQLFYGPLSEGFGRRYILMLGLVINLVGSVICMKAQSIDQLIFGRFIQGCGAGACASLWRSVFRDIFNGVELAKYGSYLSVFIILIIPAAPVVGGYLQEIYGWRASFIFLFLYALTCLLLVVFVFKETSLHHHKERMKLSFVTEAYSSLLKNRIFMGYCICVFFNFSAYFSWFTVGPVILIKHLGYSPAEFGWISLISGVIALSLGSFVNGRYVESRGITKMLRIGWGVNATAGLLLFAGYAFFGAHMLSIVLPVTLFFFGAALIFSNCFAGAFTHTGKIAGYAGGLYGSLQIAGGALTGAVISFLPDVNQIPLAFVFFISASSSWLLFEKVILPAEKLQ